MQRGGAGVEVFSGQGKDPVAKWKLYGGQSAIRKEYDKGVKGFVYCLEGSSKSVKMHLPDNGKMSLGLLQRFLAIQVIIPEGKDFSMELLITDAGHLKRRLFISTVHKELSATLWHAKLPLAGVKRNIWTTLFVDLVSLTGELFKATGFLSLDGITLFANCKVRRIFTVKTAPTVMERADVFFSGATVEEPIPRSCMFPPSVCQENLVLNMEVLEKANLKKTNTNTDGGPDRHPAARSTSSYRSKPQASPHRASGSKAEASTTYASRKGVPAANAMEKGEPCAEKTAYLNRTYRQGNVAVENPERSYLHQEEHTLVGHSRRNESREKYSPPSSGVGSRQEPLTSKEITQVLKEGTSSPSPRLAEPLPSSTRPTSPHDPQVRSCWESNDEEPELQLSLREKVFTFVSPHPSPERGQGWRKQKMETRDDQVQRPNETHGVAQPGDDFTVRENDEEMSSKAFPHLTLKAGSNSDFSKCLDLNLELKVLEEKNTEETTVDHCPTANVPDPQLAFSKKAEIDGVAHRHCHSSCGNRLDQKCEVVEAEERNHMVDEKNSITLLKSHLQEDVWNNSLKILPKEEINASQPGVSGDWHLNPNSSLLSYMVGNDELQILTSLKREQEDNEHKALGSTTSQIRQCNVSTSLSSEEMSTWAHISTPGNEGQHYQKEMKPLQSSISRDWMNVLGPPILPSSSQRRSDNTSNHHQDQIQGGKEFLNEEEMEDGHLNLLYDPCINSYFDPGQRNTMN
ncbi:protein CFAP20DC isoform X2 [Stigmatopora nigra]